MLYLFRCNSHGNFDVMQDMDDKHEANCPECGEPMRRIYTASYLPTHPTRGKTRGELFDNLAKDGLAPKDWQANDSYLHAALGAENGI